jgi:fructose-bisphosphate aldolase class II
VTFVHTGALLASAVASESAVFAFNVITLEHAEAIVTGAERAGRPALLQVSENAVHFHGGRLAPLLAACNRLAIDADVPIGLHLDHFTDEALIRESVALARDVGVTSIMVDAAQLPFAENQQHTRALTHEAHDAGLWVEAELGEIGGKDGAHAPGVRTDPDDAAAFVRVTRVDGLAVAVGSSHAMTSRDAVIDLELVERLAVTVPVPLVLHGSSGVSDAVIRDVISAGIRKVNVGTALNLAFTGEVRRYLAGDPASSDPRKYLAGAREAIAERVEHLCSLV